jgi:hypothetical protein
MAGYRALQQAIDPPMFPLRRVSGARRTDPHARTVVAPASVSITGESASSATTNGRGPWPRNQDAAFALVVFDVLDVLDVPDVLDDSKRRPRHARRRCTADFMA